MNSMKGKYAAYYWSVKKHPKGYVWSIRGNWKKGTKVLQSSLGEDFPEDKYFKTQELAMYAAKENIRDYYTY